MKTPAARPFAISVPSPELAPYCRPPRVPLESVEPTAFLSVVAQLMRDAGFLGLTCRELAAAARHYGIEADEATVERDLMRAVAGRVSPLASKIHAEATRRRETALAALED